MWTNYDPNTQTLRLADPKGKRLKAVDHVLPVSTSVARELAALSSLRGEGDFIFSSSGGVKAIHHTTISGEIREVARKGKSSAGYRPGDLRRTAETRLQALGVSRDVRAQLLSHGRSGGVQAEHYERHDYVAEKTAALALWERHLKGVTSPDMNKAAAAGREIGGSAAAESIAIA